MYKAKSVSLGRLRRSHLVQLVVILLLAALLRFAALGRNSLWFDEAWGVFKASQPVADTLAGDIDEWRRPPLFVLGLHYWIRWVGDSETALRLPSALASLLNVGLVHLLGLQLGGRRVGLVAMSLLALSPLHVWYAQEVRMYIFVACLGLVAANGLAWGHWPAILPVSLALAAGLYVDFPMIPLSVGLSASFFCVWWIQGRPKRPFFVWLFSITLAAFLYQPWWSRTAELFERLNHIHVFLLTRQALHLPEFSAIQYVLMMAVAGVGLICLFGLLHRALRHDRIRPALTLLIVVPFLLMTVAFVWPRLFGVKRVLATGWPYVCLLVAWLLVTWEGKGRSAWYTLMAISLVASVWMLWAVPKDDWRGVVAHLNVHAQPGDIVWLDPTWNHVAYEYYRPEHLAYYGGIEQLQQLASSDIWLVADRFPGRAIPSSRSEAWLDKNLRLVERIPLYRLEIRRYRR